MKPIVDPDNPPWTISFALGMWVVSIITILAMPMLTQIAWAIRFYSLNSKLPLQADMINDPSLYVYSLLSTAIAHILTVLIIWLIIHKFLQEDFLKTLGWNWPPMFQWYHCLGILGMVICFLAIGSILEKLIPSQETNFAKILKMGVNVRIAVAFTAALTAPFTEELVYRGVLYGAFRKKFGYWKAITIVTLLFFAIHVPQYWGGWAGLSLLVLLSLVLTLMRAYTRSLLPSFLLHTAFNGLVALTILFVPT